MSDRDDFRALADEIRGDIPDGLGLRSVAVYILFRSEAGAKRPGMPGTVTDRWTRISNNGKNPKVSEVSSKDVVASGGQYVAGDIKIGPFTPVFFETQGNLPESYDPAVPAPLAPNVTGTIYYVIVPLAVDGAPAWCKRVSTDNDYGNFNRTVIVRRQVAVPVGAVIPT